MAESEGRATLGRFGVRATDIMPPVDCTRSVGWVGLGIVIVIVTEKVILRVLLRKGIGCGCVGSRLGDSGDGDCEGLSGTVWSCHCSHRCLFWRGPAWV
ncbi:hypothetical protein BO70DRAFT_18971 [Aspergillus heteromorphus CBS 117.55]|uniref:Uncharacterized protein n=1 Tax=Aspergillus heteromorphus CBS 117.55 TaxID=1448321 RepID=A0A317X7C6_9EURO|nr:uncharacterized protein BO70DRAFT_18971 [Aspergillus heteromorphus CBS 117.55]PWY92778.1 hypothetical protein BO70DRAFT_18971 [Aspergillus heteromorphus CBS 117.55]